MVRVRAASLHFLDVRQRRAVQGRVRAQEVTCSGEEVVDVFSELPVIRTHDSCSLMYSNRGALSHGCTAATIQRPHAHVAVDGNRRKDVFAQRPIKVAHLSQ